MSPLLSYRHVARWLDVSEGTIGRMVKDGRLPQPVLISKWPLLPAEVVLPQILQDEDVQFAGGVTLGTHNGPSYFELIPAKYKLNTFGAQFAVFEALNKTIHIRQWKTSFVFLPDWLGHCPIILSCENDRVGEFPMRDLHAEVCTAPEGFYERLSREGFYEASAAKEQCQQQSDAS